MEFDDKVNEILIMRRNFLSSFSNRPTVTCALSFYCISFCFYRDISANLKYKVLITSLIYQMLLYMLVVIARATYKKYAVIIYMITIS